jgi:Flp pilus assembly protein TadG
VSAVRRLAAHVSGNAATLFALAMVPVVCVAGAAIDYARVTKVRAQLSGALDASLDAVDRAPAADPGQEYASLRNRMQARLGARFEAPWRIESLSVDGGQLAATVTAEVSTTVARLIGITHVPIRVSAEAGHGPG